MNACAGLPRWCYSTDASCADEAFSSPRDKLLWARRAFYSYVLSSAFTNIEHAWATRAGRVRILVAATLDLLAVQARK